MGISFMFMWVFSLLEMWLYRQIFIESGGVYGKKLKVLFLATITPERRAWIKSVLSLAMGKVREKSANTVVPFVVGVFKRVTRHSD